MSFLTAGEWRLGLPKAALTPTAPEGRGVALEPEFTSHLLLINFKILSMKN